jgi:hypothetical protein
MQLAKRQQIVKEHLGRFIAPEGPEGSAQVFNPLPWETQFHRAGPSRGTCIAGRDVEWRSSQASARDGCLTGRVG